MNNNSTARFGDVDLWIRLVYMILFAFLSVVSRFVICLTGLVQFVLVLFSGEDNYRLRSFGNSLSRWTYDAYRFITFNSEQKPFPFMDWPEGASTVVETPADPQANVPTVTDVVTTEENEHPNQEPKT